MAVVCSRRDGDVMIVVADNPPVNALGAAVRQGLAEAIALARADDSVRAVVIRASGRTFFAGADITEFGRPMEAPSLPELIDELEALEKPTVAAIHGTALGGGLEVALGCNYRVAAVSAKLGLPEVKLGILPGAGGTQRLPRVVGVEPALSIIVTGNPVSATQAKALGLVDHIVDENDLELEAIAFARKSIGMPSHPVSSGREDMIGNTPLDTFENFRSKNPRLFGGLEAPEACVQAVKAAIEMPYSEGVKVERELFLKLVSGSESAALRHAFFAERAAAKVADLPRDIPLLPVSMVGVIGAGTMGGGIAMNFLSAGYHVVIVERDQDALNRGIATIRRNYEATAAKGRMTNADVEEAMSHLTGSVEFASLAECDLVIEAVFELMDVKKEIFATLDGICKPGAILASNTSYLNIDEIASSTSRPQSVIGLHFFSPANVMQLLEIVRGAETSLQVLATCLDLSRKIKKVAVIAGVCHGFIGNRMLKPRQTNANALLLEGVLPEKIDQALLDFGFPMGPFQMADLAGLDLGWKAEDSTGSTVRELLCERGRLGQKSGKGYYDYDEKRTRTPSSEVNAIISEFAARSGMAPREISQQEIVERLLFPMVNEGCLILEEGIAARPGDIDVVWIKGYGWPARTGGPMFWAEAMGWDVILAGLERYRERMPEMRISRYLRDRASSQTSFEQ